MRARNRGSRNRRAIDKKGGVVKSCRKERCVSGTELVIKNIKCPGKSISCKVHKDKNYEDPAIEDLPGALACL